MSALCSGRVWTGDGVRRPLPVQGSVFYGEAGLPHARAFSSLLSTPSPPQMRAIPEAPGTPPVSPDFLAARPLPGNLQNNLNLTNRLF